MKKRHWRNKYTIPRAWNKCRHLYHSMIDGLLLALPLRARISLDFFRHQGKFPRLDSPHTFSEKIARRKLFDRDPRMPILTDKILVKQHVMEVLGAEWVIPTLWSGEKLPPRSERNWPIPYVLKANHGSSWNIFVRSEEDQDWDQIEKFMQSWLKTTFGQVYGEWLYTQIKPGLLVEPFVGTGGIAPPDYKLFVFAGRTELIQVDLGRLQKHRQFFYDTKWNRQPITYVCPDDGEEIEPPASLAKMISAADLLGAHFPFVRIDLYEIGGEPKFGEFTFYPNSGNVPFKPESVELELGRLWLG
jgi:hypothetical protein